MSVNNNSALFVIFKILKLLTIQNWVFVMDRLYFTELGNVPSSECFVTSKGVTLYDGDKKVSLTIK